MNRKGFIMITMVVGSGLGGLVPLLWGDSGFSMSSVLLTAAGGIAGIWAGYKLSA